MAAEAVWITLDGPGKNALSTPLMTDLRDRLHDAGDAPILLTGAGDAFSAGLDLRELASLDDEAMTDFLDLLEETVGALYHHPGPTVAFVNGHAIAGGCVLALCCDRRIGLPGRYRIGLNEVRNGLQFPLRTLEILRRQVPRPSWARVLLGAELVDPDTALRLGLLDELGEIDAARAVLADLEGLPRAAYSATKAALRPPTTVEPAARRAFLGEVLPAWTDPALKARLKALLAR
jgi:enoyl-CoA hydratase